MAFKLGKESRGFKHSGNVKIVSTPLDKGTIAEANNDGTIFVDKSIPSGSAKEKEVVGHEGQHMDDMASGKLAYGDDYIRYNGRTFHRKNGKINYNGSWKPEGDKSFPWEKRAYKAGNAAKK